MGHEWTLRRHAVHVVHELRSVDGVNYTLSIIGSCVLDVVRILLALQLLVQDLKALLSPALLAKGIGEVLILRLEILLLDVQAYSDDQPAKLSAAGRRRTRELVSKGRDFSVGIVDDVVHL